MIASPSREPRLREGSGDASEIDRESVEWGRGRARSLIRATAQPITLPYLHPVAPQLSRLSSLDTTRIYSSLLPLSRYSLTPFPPPRFRRMFRDLFTPSTPPAIPYCTVPFPFGTPSFSTTNFVSNPRPPSFV